MLRSDPVFDLHPGDRMHHAGQSLAATSNVPPRGLWVDAGVLATRAPHEEEHQGHPHPPSELGQGIAGLSGYSRLGPCPPDWPILPKAPPQMGREDERLLTAAGCHQSSVLYSDSINNKDTKKLSEGSDVYFSIRRHSMDFLLALSLSLFPSPSVCSLVFVFSFLFFSLPCFTVLTLSFLIDLASALLLTLHRQRP